MQELQGQGSLHQASRKLPRSGNLWHGQIPFKEIPKMPLLEAVKVKPKLQWRPQCGDAKRQMLRKAAGVEPSEERGTMFCRWQNWMGGLTKPIGAQMLPLKPQIQDVELLHLVFTLLDVGLALV